MNYEEFLEGLSLRHFHPREITSQGERLSVYGVKNSLPPENKWEAIVPVLWIADLARRELGFSLIITSAYRSPAYNAAVGGASQSQHLANTALDLIPGGGTVDDLYGQLQEMRLGLTFKGGLGLYRSSGFVHVDTRGTNATWEG